MAISHTARVTLNEPSDEIDLEAWLFGLSDCRLPGLRQGPSRRRCVQRRAGARHDQHRVDRRPPDRAALPAASASGRSTVEMDSPASRVYLFHLVPVAAGVRWTLDVTPKTTGGSELACTVQVELPAALGVLARLSLLGHFLGRHVDEEARGFAADIARKHITRSTALDRAVS